MTARSATTAELAEHRPCNIVENTFAVHGLSWLLRRLRREPGFTLVGGSVRDGMVAAEPRDIDLAVPNGDRTAHQLLDQFADGWRNRHGNWSFNLPSGGHVDLIEPQNFYRNFDTTEAMLGFFDLSVNAMGIDLLTNEVLDPLGGLADLRASQVTLPVNRWTTMCDFESVHLALRTLRLLRRHPLTIVNPELLVRQVPKVERVHWRDLQRLNKMGRDEALRSLTELCSAALSLPDPFSQRAVDGGR